MDSRHSGNCPRAQAPGGPAWGPSTPQRPPLKPGCFSATHSRVAAFLGACLQVSALIAVPVLSKSQPSPGLPSIQLFFTTYLGHPCSLSQDRPPRGTAPGSWILGRTGCPRVPEALTGQFRNPGPTGERSWGLSSLQWGYSSPDLPTGQSWGTDCPQVTHPTVHGSSVTCPSPNCP